MDIIWHWITMGGTAIGGAAVALGGAYFWMRGRWSTTSRQLREDHAKAFDIENEIEIRAVHRLQVRNDELTSRVFKLQDSIADIQRREADCERRELGLKKELELAMYRVGDALKVKETADEVKKAAAVVADRMAEGSKSIRDAQDKQHELMNSRLDEMKQVLIDKAHAEGELLGRARLQAELDSKAAAVAEALKVKEPIPVTVVPVEGEPLPVVVEKLLK